MNGTRGGIVLRLTLMMTAGVLVAGFLTLQTSFLLVRRLETDRQRQAMETLLNVSAASATTACFAGDAGIGGQVVRDLVATHELALATLKTEQGVLAEARMEGAAPGPLRFSRRLYSPFNPDLQVGELVLAPAPGQIERNSTVPKAILRVGTALRILALTVIVAACLQLYLVPPLKDLAQAVRTMDPQAPADLVSPLAHRRDEFGVVFREVNGLLGRFNHALGALRDEQARLLQDKRKAQAILENLDAGLFVLRGDGSLDTWTPALLRLLDLQHTPPKVGAPIQDLFGTGAEAVERCLARCGAEASEATELIRVRRLPPEPPTWLKLHLRRIGPDWIQGLLEERSLHGTPLADDLDGKDLATGALNRFGADRAIEDHLANRTTGLGLLRVTLDPDLPEEAIRRLSLPLSPGDRVAHLDPGEYLILMEDLGDPERARTLGRHIQTELETPWTAPGPTVTARLGLVLWNPQDEPSRTELMERADAALRQAKPVQCPVG